MAFCSVPRSVRSLVNAAEGMSPRVSSPQSLPPVTEERLSAPQQGIASKGPVVVFQQAPPAVGDRIEQQIAVRLQLLMRVDANSGEASQSVSTEIGREQKRIVEVLETADNQLRKARVTFASSRNQSPENVDPTRLTPQLVHGKTYFLLRDGERMSVTDSDGAIPPLAEYELAVEALQHLGKPHPLAELLIGRPIRVGERLQLPEAMAEELLGLGEQVGAIRRFDLALNRVDAGPKPTDSPRAVFTAVIEAAADHDSPMALTMHGELHIETATCRTLVAQFQGPVEMKTYERTTQSSADYAFQGDLEVVIRSQYDRARK